MGWFIFCMSFFVFLRVLMIVFFLDDVGLNVNFVCIFCIKLGCSCDLKSNL